MAHIPNTPTRQELDELNRLLQKMIATPDANAMSSEAMAHLASCVADEPTLHDRMRLALVLALSAATVDERFSMAQVLGATPRAITHVATYLANRPVPQAPTVH